MKNIAILLLLLAATLAPASAQNPYFSFSPASPVLITEAGQTALVSSTVKLTNSGNPVSFLITSNQGWLSVSPASGTLSTGQSMDLIVSADPKQVQSGTYTGVVSVTPSQASGLPVGSFTVTFNITGIAFLANPDHFDFAVGPESSDTKVLNLAVSDGSVRPIEVTAVTQSGGNWLQVTTLPPYSAPMAINIRAVSSGMEAGSVFQGELRVSAPSLAGLTKVIPVTMSVLDQSPGFTVVPSQLRFYAFGSQQPPAQPVQVTAAGNRIAFFDVILSPGSTGLAANATRAVTPAVFSAQVDTSAVPQLPREDSITIRPTDGIAEQLVPVKSDLTPATIYAIPQVADGGPASAGKFRTQIVVVNQDTTAATVSLRFYKSDPATHSTLAWSPAMANNARIDTVSIPAGASWSVETAGEPNDISAGWAEIVSRERITGLAVFRQLQPDGRIQEAAVPINSSLMQRNLLAYDNTSGFVTSVAIANLSSTEPAKVRVGFRDATGRLLRVDKIADIPARGHYAFELPRLFTYLQGQRGTADFWVISGQISVLGLRFSPTGAFTSFEAQSLNRRTTGRRSIPQIADGGEFRTTITLVNNDATTANVRLNFFRNDKNSGATLPWTIPFLNDINPANLTIPPGTSITIESAGLGTAVQQGWAEVVTDQWVTGFAVFRQTLGSKSQEAAVPVNVGVANRQMLPFDNSGGFTTSLAVANLSANVEATINFTFRDQSGARLVQAALPGLLIQGHKAFRVVDVWPELEGKKGVLEISTLAGETSVLGLRFSSGGAFTSFKAQPVQ